MYAEVKKYSYAKDSVKVEKTAECKDGKKFSFTSTMNIKGNAYGKTHFGSRVRDYKSVDACMRGDQCLRNIQSRNILTTKEAFTEVDACIPGKRR